MSPAFLLTWLKGDNRAGPSSSRLRTGAIKILESPIGQTLPEISTVLFLVGGRFLEFGRRITGLSYVSAHGVGEAKVQVSTTRRRPHETRSYEPLALLLGLPLGFRILMWYRKGRYAPTGIPDVLPIQEGSADQHSQLPAATDDVTTSDHPNTYLSPWAQGMDGRQCILCLEQRGSGEGSAGTVAVTECGHAFCWGCLGNLDKVSLIVSHTE